MNKIRKGDIVGRISYNKDIIFIVKDMSNKHNIILQGVFERIIVDSDIGDLVLINREEFRQIEIIKDLKLRKKENRLEDNTITGTVLHLDGDKRYSEKSLKYYHRMRIRAVVKNIPENRQSRVVYNLLRYYRPDILVITGHDGMIKKEYGYYDIYNYRNSRHFISTIKEARRYEQDVGKDLVIFARRMPELF